MNAANKWTLVGAALVALLVVLFPSWQQFYQGHPLPYQGELGHHLIWKPPPAVGEQSWIIHASPSECQVRVNVGTLLRHCGSIAAITIVLLLAFRFPAGSQSLATSLTNRRIAVVSLLLALCIPVPGSHGLPLAALVVMAPISMFGDGGHLGPWFMPMLAGIALAAYFTGVFLVASGVVWLIRRCTRVS